METIEYFMNVDEIDCKVTEFFDSIGVKYEMAETHEWWGKYKQYGTQLTYDKSLLTDIQNEELEKLIN